MKIPQQELADQINARALAAYPKLLEEWFPAGRRKGLRFVVGDLGGDLKGESVSINISTGAWKEFSGGPGGYDAIGLFAHAKCGGDRKLAFRVLGERFRVLDGSPPQPDIKPRPKLYAVPREDWTSMLPPADAGRPVITGATMVHEYRNPGVAFPVRYVARIEKPDGTKIFVPHTYGALDGVTGWHKKHPQAPMCLYGLDRRAADPAAPMLFQEGEKKTDQVQALLGGWVCMAWSGGGNAVHKHDWSPTNGGRAYIVGDAVDGEKAMMDAAELCLISGATVWTVSTSDFPKGWDLGNAAAGVMVKNGEEVWKSETGPWTGEQIEAFIRERARLYDPDPGEMDDMPDLGEFDPAQTDDKALEGFAKNEDGIALAFAEKFKDRLRYCHTTGAWFIWTGARWQKEETKLAFCWARDVCRDLNSEGKNVLAKAVTAGAVERFAQADRAFAVTGSIWDRDSFLLGTPGGTVDLKTGLMMDARQEDFMTKQTVTAPADPGNGEDCPMWLAFLKQATKGDDTLIRFMQQIAGYSLTGDTREHALFFIYGPGGNGKGVFLNTITKVMGDYATSAAMDTFTASQSDKHPTDLAKLKGARLVTASETEEGRAWAESRIKALTGGDRISARFMRQDFFEFDPAFKLLIVGNHKPILRNVDDAARRRFNIIPFIHKPGTPDKLLEKKLEAERPAILRWMIDGCLDWQRNGLVRPASVGKATAEYFNSQDLFGQWLEECCELYPGNDMRLETAADLFASWKEFAESNGEQAGSGKSFGDKLTQRDVGSAQRRVGGKKCKMRTGISLVRPPPEWAGRD